MNRSIRRLIILVIAIALTICTANGIIHTHSAQAQPSPIRRVDPADFSARVYEQMPTLPLENQYISSNTGQVAADNTLVSRIIRYHLYNKKRPTNFRFDWKLTMADYLGAFDRIAADNYADYGLRENPMEADIAAVQKLSREERDRLTNTLYKIFTTPTEPNTTR